VPFPLILAVTSLFEVLAAIAMTHATPGTTGGDVLFWFFFVAWEFFFVGPALLVVSTLASFVPEELWGTAQTVATGLSALAFAAASVFALGNAAIAKAEGVMLNGHPASYTDSIILLAFICLLQVLLALVSLLFIDKDRETLRRLVGENAQLLPHVSEPLASECGSKPTDGPPDASGAHVPNGGAHAAMAAAAAEAGPATIAPSTAPKSAPEAASLGDELPAAAGEYGEGSRAATDMAAPAPRAPSATH